MEKGKNSLSVYTCIILSFIIITSLITVIYTYTGNEGRKRKTDISGCRAEIILPSPFRSFRL